MSPRHRFATFTLLLLFSACFLFPPLWADGEGNAAGPLAANNSAEQHVEGLAAVKTGSD